MTRIFQELNLDGNGIAEMTGLVDLRVYTDQISDIPVVANMPKLDHIDVAANPICDLSPAFHVPNVIR